MSNEEKGIVKRMGMGFKAFSDVIMGVEIKDKIGIKGTWDFECVRPDGSIRWTEHVENIIVNTGLDDALDKWLRGSAYTAAFFVGLKDTGAPVAADTMASHASWALIPAATFSTSPLPTLTLAAVSGQSTDNSAAKASFAIIATDTIFGAFVTDNSTVGATTGLLVSAVDFAASRNVVNLDTLNVTVTFTSASV